MLRATQFVSELEHELDRYRSSDPITASINPEIGQVSVSWKAITLKPGTIAGDAIHNLRTALDALASELARIRDRSDKDVYFPFADTAENLDAAIKNKNFSKAGDDAVALLKSIKPYRGGNEALRAMHDLDIQDKHSGILVTGSRMALKVTGTYHLDGAFEPVIDANLTDMHYIFPEDGAMFPGANVIETLKDLVELVEGILEAFASLVAART